MIYDPSIGFIEWKYTYHISDIFNNYDAEPMMFTWLPDKDGKEIYEGDIIESVDSKKEKYLIVWDEKDITFHKRYEPIKLWLRLDNTRNYLIVGNIYENPEMLIK